jgi:hypothetical protein
MISVESTFYGNAVDTPLAIVNILILIAGRTESKRPTGNPGQPFG